PVIAAARKVSVHSAFNVPVAMQRVALAALASGDAWVEAARGTYQRARDEAASALAGAPVEFALPEGGVYLFLDFAELLGGRPLKVLLERAIAHGVLLAPGESCGAAHATSARLCFTSEPLPRVLEGIARLREAMREL
ncbi:MAG TPA: aminotransferase class I/II-fold pyridoxal phosphate-dependent enzyme, partial [Polyangiaceae bacterium]|nr:aminotransferase class I/II-fold pyridoxal phosphate-dependent enzyme [Polyangiaceae bacterium]